MSLPLSLGVGRSNSHACGVDGIYFAPRVGVVVIFVVGAVGAECVSSVKFVKHVMSAMYVFFRNLL